MPISAAQRALIARKRSEALRAAMEAAQELQAEIAKGELGLAVCRFQGFAVLLPGIEFWVVPLSLITHGSCFSLIYFALNLI